MACLQVPLKKAGNESAPGAKDGADKAAAAGKEQEDAAAAGDAAEAEVRGHIWSFIRLNSEQKT